MNGDWAYVGDLGPKNWYLLFSAANGPAQSPIDIPGKKLKIAYSYRRRKLTMDYVKELNTIINIGYFWNLTTEECRSEIYGGPLKNRYRLEQIRAHWGEHNAKGSEHSLNGILYDAEIHIEHFDINNYSGFSEASNYPDGLCNLAILVKLGAPHPEIQKIVNKMHKIMHNGDITKLDHNVNAYNLLPKSKKYWSYRGSQTSPPCMECVIWIIFEEPIEMSAEQLDSFRNIRHHVGNANNACLHLKCPDKVTKNARPINPLGERFIIRGGKFEGRISQ